MAHARVLTTAELGVIRFAQAEQDQKFPVEFKFRESSKSPSSIRPFEIPLYLTVTAEDHSSSRIPATSSASLSLPLVKVAKGEYVAVVSLPPGPLTYLITQGNLEIAAGGLEVIPPDAPVGNTRRASQLSSRAPSGAKQKENSLSPTSKSSISPTDVCSSDTTAERLWDVDFVYNEEPWSVREIWVELLGRQDPFQMRPAHNRESFSVTIPLPAGPVRYRFRVALRDPCRPDTAPLTRLGWDPSVTNSRGLATWELALTVNDLRAIAFAGSGIMAHYKKLKTHTETGDTMANKKFQGATVVSSVHVKSVIGAKLENSLASCMFHEDPREASPNVFVPDPGEANNRKPDTGQTMQPFSALSAKTMESKEDSHKRGAACAGSVESFTKSDCNFGCKSGRMWLAVASFIGLSLFALLSITGGHQDESSDFGSEDDIGPKRRTRFSIPGYFKLATSQGV